MFIYIMMFVNLVIVISIMQIVFGVVMFEIKDMQEMVMLVSKVFSGMFLGVIFLNWVLIMFLLVSDYSIWVEVYSLELVIESKVVKIMKFMIFVV